MRGHRLSDHVAAARPTRCKDSETGPLAAWAAPSSEVRRGRAPDRDRAARLRRATARAPRRAHCCHHVDSDPAGLGSTDGGRRRRAGRRLRLSLTLTTGGSKSARPLAGTATSEPGPRPPGHQIGTKAGPGQTGPRPPRPVGKVQAAPSAFQGSGRDGNSDVSSGDCDQAQAGACPSDPRAGSWASAALVDEPRPAGANAPRLRSAPCACGRIEYGARLRQGQRQWWITQRAGAGRGAADRGPPAGEWMARRPSGAACRSQRPRLARTRHGAAPRLLVGG